jgi:hypothetical protein
MATNVGIDVPEDLESMSADDLEDLLRAMNNEHAQRRQAILDVHKVYDRKRETEQALAKLGNLTANEIASLEAAIKSGTFKPRDEEPVEVAEEGADEG